MPGILFILLVLMAPATVWAGPTFVYQSNTINVPDVPMEQTPEEHMQEVEERLIKQHTPPPAKAKPAPAPAPAAPATTENPAFGKIGGLGPIGGTALGNVGGLGPLPNSPQDSIQKP